MKRAPLLEAWQTDFEMDAPSRRRHSRGIALQKKKPPIKYETTSNQSIAHAPLGYVINICASTCFRAVRCSEDRGFPASCRFPPTAEGFCRECRCENPCSYPLWHRNYIEGTDPRKPTNIIPPEPWLRTGTHAPNVCRIIALHLCHRSEANAARLGRHQESGACWSRRLHATTTRQRGVLRGWYPIFRPCLGAARDNPWKTMSLIQFTRNHTDHSTDNGYQFEFFCDRCGNGFMSEFQPSAHGPCLQRGAHAGQPVRRRAGQRGRVRLRDRTRGPGDRRTTRRFGKPSRKPNRISANVPSALTGSARPPAGTQSACCASIARPMWKPRWPPRRCRPSGPDEAKGAAAGPHQGHGSDFGSDRAVSQLRRAHPGRQILPGMRQAATGQRRVPAMRHPAWKPAPSSVRNAATR